MNWTHILAADKGVAQRTYIMCNKFEINNKRNIHPYYLW